MWSSRLFLPLLLLTLLLNSCGGGSSYSSTTPPETPPAPPTPPPTAPLTTQTSGVITGFGSVFINGIEYETTSTEVSTDDDIIQEADLQVGMIVTLTGSLNDDGHTGSADAIHYSEQLKGPLQSIDLLSNSLVILGQTVFYDELTSLSNLVLDDLVPGDFLEISGFLNADNDFFATRIEKEDQLSHLKIQGIIAALNTDTTTFSLGDLVINYHNATFTNLTSAELINGLAITVKGDVSALIDNVFSADKITRFAPEQEHQEGAARHIEGIISSFVSAQSFIVNGIHIISNESTEFKHGSAASLLLNVRVKIKGHYDNNGDLLADEIRIHQRTNLKIEGMVTALNLNDQTVTVNELVFTISDDTKMEDDSDLHERFFDLNDIALGDWIEIKGFIDNSGHSFATKLNRKNQRGEDEHEAELKGMVSSITDETFIIVGIVIHTTENTLFIDDNNLDMSKTDFFAQLTDGMIVEAEGVVINEEFIANKVKLENHHDDDHGGTDRGTEFRGSIDEITATGLVVAGHQIIITTNTQFEVNDNFVSAEQFWQLVTLGDQIKIKGIIGDQGTITAHEIELEIEHQQGVAKATVFGASLFTENSLQIANHTVQFDHETKFDGLDGDLSYEQFLLQKAQWLFIEAKGIMREDIIFAKEIKQRSEDNSDYNIKIEAFVEQITDNGIALANHNAEFNAQTKFISANMEVSQSEFMQQLTLHTKVEIEGQIQLTSSGDNSFEESILVTEIKFKT